jgi:hypothetical protein
MKSGRAHIEGIGAVILFPTHFAETPDDAAIERLVEQTCRFMIAKAEKRKLGISEIVCATQELMARFLVAPLFSGSATRAQTEELISQMMGIATRRAMNLLDGKPPGEEDRTDS